MQLEVLLVITIVVMTLGTVTAHVFRESGSPYLLNITGTKAQLIAAGTLIWTLAVAAGLIALIVLSTLMTSVIALALFFGIEAVALDICAHRIKYERVEQPFGGRVRVTSPIHF